jgi:hypothetical protein
LSKLQMHCSEFHQWLIHLNPTTVWRLAVPGHRRFVARIQVRSRRAQGTREACETATSVIRSTTSTRGFCIIHTERVILVQGEETLLKTRQVNRYWYRYFNMFIRCFNSVRYRSVALDHWTHL